MSNVQHTPKDQISKDQAKDQVLKDPILETSTPQDQPIPLPSMHSSTSFRNRLHEIIFETGSWAGKAFDIALLVAIIISVTLVMLESVAEVRNAYASQLIYLEWCFTLLFTLEYILRIYCVHNARRYIFSFYGLIDLFAILPSYLEYGISISAGSFASIRILRLLRVFRIFKLSPYLLAGNHLTSALKASREKITVFLTFVMISVVILGSIMYLIESGSNPAFSSIPRSIYWAIVTLTTVGYGDIAPHTILGQAVASAIMILGYGVLAVPTGIVSAEMVKQDQKVNLSDQVCKTCMLENHDADAHYCKRCGSLL